MNKHALERLRGLSEKAPGTVVAVNINDLDAILISHEKLGRALALALNLRVEVDTEQENDQMVEAQKILAEEKGVPWDR